MAIVELSWGGLGLVECEDGGQREHVRGDVAPDPFSTERRHNFAHTPDPATDFKNDIILSNADAVLKKPQSFLASRLQSGFFRHPDDMQFRLLFCG